MESFSVLEWRKEKQWYELNPSPSKKKKQEKKTYQRKTGQAYHNVTMQRYNIRNIFKCQNMGYFFSLEGTWLSIFSV